jgi:hypothetical protein
LSSHLTGIAKCFPFIYTIKPVLRGHLWDKEKWPNITGDFLIEVEFIWNCQW